MGFAGIAAVLLSVAPLSAITADQELFVQVAVLVGGLLFGGMVLRLLRVPDVVTSLVLLAAWTAHGALGLGGLAPGFPWGERLSLVFEEAVNHIQTQLAPMEADASVRFFLVAFVGLIAILWDLCAVSCRSAAAALLPLSVVYIIAAVSLTDDLTVWQFLPVAAAMCITLLTAEADHVARWGTGLSVDASPPRQAGRLGPVAAVTAGVLAVTVLAGLLVPAMPSRFSPNGATNSIVLTDPSLDLRRNLIQPTDRTVLRYTSTDSDGAYLRMATLPRFDATGWHLGQGEIRYSDPFGSPPGFTGAGETHTGEFEISGLASAWLPLPYAPRSVEADRGRWGFDPLTLDVIASSGDTDGLSYSVEWLDVEPTSDQLARAFVGTPAEGATVTSLPNDLPGSIASLATEITRDAGSPHAKAAAIQAYLRSDLFTYSTEPQPGTGYDALVRFLLGDRMGYCEQFAASFAVLGRAVGLPTRVVVGFLPGTRTADGFEVSIRSMHAWPEVFYEELGWTRYEPTPGVATAPGYTETTDDPSTPAPTAEPTTTTPTAMPPSTSPAERPDQDEGQPTISTTESWVSVAGAIAGALAAIALASVPGGVRARRRRTRLEAAAVGDGDGIEAAWAELRDTVTDLGREWPGGSSRAAAAALCEVLPGDGAAAVRRLATAVELVRYAPPAKDGTGNDDIAQTTWTVIEQLQTQATRAQRMRARVLPPSLWCRPSW
jgi:transglutaminase-like putative cysteine protease